MNFKTLNFCLLFFIQLFLINFFIIKNGSLYWFSTRYYDPKMSRFISSDPIIPKKDAQGINRYTYVFNKPLKLIDPSGNTPVGSNSESPFTLLSASNPLNIRMDFDALGHPIPNKGPIDISSDNSNSIRQATQAATFATRETLKIMTQFSNRQGVADLLILNDLDAHSDLVHSGKLATHGNTKSANIFYSQYAAPEVEPWKPYTIQGLPKNYPAAAGFKNPVTLQSVVVNRWSITGFNRWVSINPYDINSLNLEDAGIASGLSQTPVLVDKLDNYITTAVRKGALIPTSLAGVGGFASIITYKDDPNPLFRSAGLALGGTEVLGAGMYYTGAWAAGSGAAGSATLMAWGSKAMMFGGVWTLALTAGVLAYRDGALEDPIPKYTANEALDMRMKAQGISQGPPEEKNNSHPFGGSTR